MKPIIDNLPKFLKVNNYQTSLSHNKYLPHPYHEGEVVKVQDAELQKPDHKYDNMTPRVPPTTDEFWKQHYVRIFRKDKDGKFTHSCVIEWSGVDMLAKNAEKANLNYYIEH